MIRMNDFKAESADLRKAMLAAVERVFDSGWYILGDEVADFEQQWARTCDIAYAVGVGNGMDAIEISIRALNLARGDEVITTPMTAFATVLAIIRAGAVPVLADIDPSTALLSIESVARCISIRTKALVLVHLYGQVREMEKWQAFCGDNQLALIEDCAQAHLACWNGKFAGSFGRAGAYSFYPTKNLGAIGDAGMIVTEDAALAAYAKVLRNYGQTVRYNHPQLGLNSRLDELQAALLSVRLRSLSLFTERRRQIASIYRSQIRNDRIKLLSEPIQVENHAYHLFVVTCEQRDRLAKYLLDNGIETYVHYPIPVHIQPPCRDLRRDPSGLTATEQHSKTCLSIPCHPQMTDSDLATIVYAANSFR